MHILHTISSLLFLGVPRPSRMWRPTGLMLLALLMAACGNTAGDNPTGASRQDDRLATFNPCEMLTPAEIESIFGEPAAADAEPTSAGPVRSCSFHNDRGGQFFLLQLGPETAIEVDARVEGVTLVPDLGDEAVFSSGMLRVRVGETVLQVSTWHPRGRQDEALAMTQDIARLALYRLP